MKKKFMVPDVVPEGSDFKSSEIEVEVPDEWNKLETDEEQEALTYLMKHYLQKRWDEQYQKIVNKEQKNIFLILLKNHALDDFKRDIRYTMFRDNLTTLSKYVIQAYKRLKEMQVKDYSPNQLAPAQEEKHQSSSLRKL